MVAKTCLKGVGENQFLETLILEVFKTQIFRLKFPPLGKSFLTKVTRNAEVCTRWTSIKASFVILNEVHFLLWRNSMEKKKKKLPEKGKQQKRSFFN